MLAYGLPGDGGISPKHVGVNKGLYCSVCLCAHIGFINGKLTFMRPCIVINSYNKVN